MTCTAPARPTTTAPAGKRIDHAPYFDPRMVTTPQSGMSRDAVPVDAIEQMFAYYTA